MDLIERAMARMEGKIPASIDAETVEPILVRTSSKRPVVDKPEPRIGYIGGQPGSVTSGAATNAVVAVRTKRDANSTREAVSLKLSSIGAESYLNPKKRALHTIEGFRRIKRPLLANAYGQGVKPVPLGRRILVTSATPGEGKTFTSIHLALSIAAEKDSTVVLVDADIVHPSVSPILDVMPRSGLTDWFESGQIHAADLVVDTNVERLRLLPAGSKSMKSCEYLASRTMANLFKQLAAEFPEAIILLDSPPMLAASEVKTLASHVGQVVLVVGAGMTSEAQVNEAVDMLDPEQSLSLVLNRSRQSSAYKNYGY